MYRRRSRHRYFCGELSVKFLFPLLLLVSSPLFACWRLEGEFVNGPQTVRINQMVNHDQTYSITAGDLILNFKIPNSKSQNIFNYELIQRKKSHLKSIVKNNIQLKKNLQEVIHFPEQTKSELKLVLKEI